MVLEITKFSIKFTSGGTLPLPFADKSPTFTQLIQDQIDNHLDLLGLPGSFEGKEFITDTGYLADDLLAEVAKQGSYEFLTDKINTPKRLGQLITFFGVTFWVLAKHWGIFAYTDDFLTKLQDLSTAKYSTMNIDDRMAAAEANNVIEDAVRGFAGTSASGEETKTEFDDMAFVSQDILDTLSEDQGKLLIELAKVIAEVNSHEAYSVTRMALGKLNVKEYLLLPKSLQEVITPYKDVGKPWDKIRPDIGIETLAQIYTLNKAANMDVKDPVMFALIRLEAVKMGWVRGQREISWVEDADDAIPTFIGDRDDIISKMEIARLAAFLIPLMAENVFRITGHHYLSGSSDEYDRKYQTIANASLCANITGILRPSELYHRVLHWVSPAVARRVLMAQLTLGTIPNAIELRAHAAPSGTAIVTTTSAVIDAMRASQIAAEIIKYGGFDFDKITDAAAAVRDNVTGFHQAYYAYGVSKANADELSRFEEGKLEAIRFAPIAQGFIDAYHQNGALANARSLRKYAENAPVLAKRALRVFKNLSKQDTESIVQLFQVAPEDTKATPTPTAAAGNSTAIGV